MFILIVLYVVGCSRPWRDAAGSLRREQQRQTIRVTGQLVPKEVQRLRTHCNASTQAKPVIKPRKVESSLVRSLERQKKPEEQNRLRPADYFCSTHAKMSILPRNGRKAPVATFWHTNGFQPNPKTKIPTDTLKVFHMLSVGHHKSTL